MDIDAELRPGLDVVEVVHDEGDVEGVGQGLDMVGGGGGDGPEDPGHPGVEEVTQGLAGLETVITGVPGGENNALSEDRIGYLCIFLLQRKKSRAQFY